MKKNQIFSFKRFGKYTFSKLLLGYPRLLLSFCVAIIAVFLFSFFSIHHTFEWKSNTFEWKSADWMFIVSLYTLIFGLLYVGSGFPALRSKTKSISFLMIPVSSFEKYLYEFIERILLFCIIFPAIFYIFGNLALNCVIKMRSLQDIVFNNESLSYNELWKLSINGKSWVILPMVVLCLSLAFTGTAVFRKNPLVKMITITGAIIISIAGYLYLIFEKFELHSPWIYILKDLNKEQGITLITVIIIFLSLVALIFAFFKLKEKEVS